MQKWRRVIIFDFIMIVIAIWLYLPSALGLFDLGNPFKMTIGVIAAAIIVYELVRVNGRALLTDRATKRITAGEDDIPVEDVRRMLGEYEKTSVVGTYARHAIDELDRAAAKRDSLRETIGQKFQEESLTWHKFIDVVESANQAITQNTALLARRIQEFDVDDYNKNARDTISGLFKRSTIPDSLRQEKRALYESSLNDMRGIVAANERVLIELDRFAQELGQLESTATAEANNRLLNEVNELVEETKYYR